MSTKFTFQSRYARAEVAPHPEFVPRETPLDMPDQGFHRSVAAIARRAREDHWVPRAAIFGGTLLLAAAFAYELYGVLSFVQITPLQILFLLFSTIAFGWVTFGSLNAALGFLPLFSGERADTIELPDVGGMFDQRTALLFPVYQEAPARIAGTIEAIGEELHALGRAHDFDVFILSDTRDEDAVAVEVTTYAALRQQLRRVFDVYYRRRRENSGRKCGNIKDWVQRFGAAYDSFIVLDGDSVMSGETLVRLARAMGQEPKAGLIQTVPRLTGAATLLQHLQQFAAHLYGPLSATGTALWQRDQGNYWGHNAIIRTKAFAAAAGLPTLPGRPPFGGDIRSHDFVEAVLLQRAGWGVHMVPTIEGSYEGHPPTVPDLVTRDRRWAQGNLQHLAIVNAPGLTNIGRLHLALGAAAYIVSAVWAASLIVGVILALQGQQLIPSYFTDEKTLFPVWPTIDPGAALRLFIATLLVVLLPKVLGLILEVKRALSTHEPHGALRACLGVATEAAFSILLAPILMVTQTASVVRVLLRIDAGWPAQRREAENMSLSFALGYHFRHTLFGALLAFLCWRASPVLVAWMSPVILGLVLAPVLTFLTSRPAGPFARAILATPEDRSPPAILREAQSATAAWSTRIGQDGSNVVQAASQIARAA